MRLVDLHNNESVYITKVLGRGAFRKRITEMGFVKGKKVQVVKSAPLDDPIEYNIMGYDISLRKSEAAMIEVIALSDDKSINNEGFKTTFDIEIEKKIREKGREINIALIGNPNSGKTTLFNFASNSKERVGNYSGVTVDSKTADFNHKNYTFHITDLPGTYSLTAYSPEELFVRRFITENMPDVVINVIDASNLERNLYLTTQLIDMDVKVVIALNMYDELESSGAKFDYQLLGKMIGVPIIPTISSKGNGIRELFDRVINLYVDKDKVYRHVHVNYGEELEISIQKIQSKIKLNRNLTDRFSSRFLSIKLIEKDKDALKIITGCENYIEIKDIVNIEIKRLELLYKEDTETVITDTRYGFISGGLKETFEDGKKTTRKISDLLDTVLTHKMLGFPVFFIFLWIMFQTTFKLGEYPKQLLEYFVTIFGSLIDSIVPLGSLNDLLTDGIISGVGGVIVFLPNILLLFFFISFMEDTGYMARVAFIMDKLMHKIGLHGKSFIPLIMGFGCNVPAIMSTRTIENRNNRLLTILINPFMSCSARLPVYILFISAFFPKHAGTMLFVIYAIGIALAIGVALIFKNTLFKANEIPFVMELPPYRMPTMRSTLKHMWHKGAQYLKKMGGVILTASIIIWALGYFPRNISYSRDYTREIAAVHLHYKTLIDESVGERQKTQLVSSRDSIVNQLVLEKSSEKQEKSYIGHLGKAIEPVMRPLGFDWKMSVSLLTGIAAKEVVVSTLGVLYQADPTKSTKTLQVKLQEQKHLEGPLQGKVVFTPIVAFGFLLFTLIYFPCIAVMAAIQKETGHWKWPAFVVFYTTVIAWVVTFIAYQIGSLL
jgi:ferrous iron transport protein B